MPLGQAHPHTCCQVQLYLLCCLGAKGNPALPSAASERWDQLSRAPHPVRGRPVMLSPGRLQQLPMFSSGNMIHRHQHGPLPQCSHGLDMALSGSSARSQQAPPSTLESLLPCLFITLKLLHVSLPSDHHILAHCGGSHCRLSTWPAGPWVTSSICAVWHGGRQVSVMHWRAGL